ncbi:hypothetical protein B296_00023998 [Ensete ventricosum]|uniref:Uncharacterized protein n=1 Tax=Ensete ventricosum TaxID=4639 RepID=A0A427A9M6_ENSVE|nr:hypothetical protein B296_00023998 [Ensete ventricosum]
MEVREFTFIREDISYLILVENPSPIQMERQETRNQRPNPRKDPILAPDPEANPTGDGVSLADTNKIKIESRSRREYLGLSGGGIGRQIHKCASILKGKIHQNSRKISEKKNRRGKDQVLIDLTSERVSSARYRIDRRRKRREGGESIAEA